MLISVIIPAFNEEQYLPKTLTLLSAAAKECDAAVEFIVVDNDSSDRTVAVAESLGATVLHEKIHNVARVRNVGARFARGDILVFVDADTTVPAHFLVRVAEAAADPNVLGGSANIVHTADSLFVRLYLGCWRMVGQAAGMVQGAAQFCRRTAFEQLGGYDESLFMGEDVDFYWRLKRLCASAAGRLEFLADVPVCPSGRRFDQRPVWRVLLVTNPLFALLFRRMPNAWPDWYVHPPR